MISRALSDHLSALSGYECSALDLSMYLLVLPDYSSIVYVLMSFRKVSLAYSETR